ncbi:hypothetical protein GR702_16240 [Novosphingobium sp. FGD1]|uniref:Uncharacterized protein n=1 Tax=Novosphingobium silvae TaxID=2692619 RepID=A0A7X4GIQ2_9SPHN|nr:hypothetical protein [Novosphingobium silvae]MYL99318.1 hypothetical protein [Novosphingobium silvae]
MNDLFIAHGEAFLYEHGEQRRRRRNQGVDNNALRFARNRLGIGTNPIRIVGEAP